MSPNRTASPISATNPAGPVRRGPGRPGAAPRSFPRPQIQPERRRPPVGPGIFDLETPDRTSSQPDEPTPAASPNWTVLDLDPISRSLTMFPPLPGDFDGARARPSAENELDIPDLAMLSGSTFHRTATAPRGSRDLERFFGGIDDSAPIRTRSLGRRFLDLLGSVWSFWRRKREMRRSIVALSEMGDRELRDIGIYHRMQIPDIVRNGR